MLLLVKEALEAIRGGRVRRGRGARFPKQPHIIVAIRLRGARVFVRNSTNCLTIAFQKVREGIGHYVPQFLHLMGMLKQDVDALQLQLLQQQKRSMPLESLKSRATTQKNLRKKGDQHLSRLTHQIQKRRLTTQKSLKTLKRLKTRSRCFAPRS